jgi:hypothetical protein
VFTLYNKAHVLFECWITKVADTLRMCNTYCFPTGSQKAPRCCDIRISIAYLVNAPASTVVQSVKGTYQMLRSAKPSSVRGLVRRHGDM